jgi:hypothetical protein
MGTAAKRTRENRTITVDFRDEAPYFQLAVYLHPADNYHGLLRSRLYGVQSRF